MKNVYVGWGPVGMTKLYSNKNKKLYLNKEKITLDLSSGFQLIITSEYTETPVWKSSNEGVVAIDQNGYVTAVGYGTSYITVISGNKKGICVITVVKQPTQDNPLDILDNSKIYYGTIKSPSFISFSDLTETEILHAVNDGTLVPTDSKSFDARISVESEGDAVVVLIPNKQIKATKQPNEVPFQESIQNYEGTGVNGTIKMGNFYIYGEILIVSGNLEIHVE